MTVRFRPLIYSLGRQLVETVLLYVLCKFALLAWAAWQPQYSHPACGTVRKHFAKPFSTSSSPQSAVCLDSWNFQMCVCRVGFHISYTRPSLPEILALKHESRILRHLSNPVCGFFMMEHVRLSSVWPMENCLGPSLNQIQCWTTVREYYSHALEQGPLLPSPINLTSFQLLHATPVVKIMHRRRTFL